MGGAIRGDAEAAPLSAAAPRRTVRSIGAFLARERRLRGIRLVEVERATRIPLRSLERLEAGAFDGGADGFSRGFVRAFAGAIGVDPEEAVSRMLAEPEPSAFDPPPGAPGRASPWLAALVALALGAAALGAGLALRSWSAAASDPAPPERVRRDHVRSLAIAEGAVPPREADAPAEASGGAPRTGSSD